MHVRGMTRVARDHSDSERMSKGALRVDCAIAAAFHKVETVQNCRGKIGRDVPFIPGETK